MATQVVFFVVEEIGEMGPFLFKHEAIKAALDAGYALVNGDMFIMRASCECGCDELVADLVERRVA